MLKWGPRFYQKTASSSAPHLSKWIQYIPRHSNYTSESFSLFTPLFFVGLSLSVVMLSTRHALGFHMGLLQIHRDISPFGTNVVWTGLCGQYDCKMPPAISIRKLRGKKTIGLLLIRRGTPLSTFFDVSTCFTCLL